LDDWVLGAGTKNIRILPLGLSPGDSFHGHPPFWEERRGKGRRGEEDVAYLG